MIKNNGNKKLIILMVLFFSITDILSQTNNTDIYKINEIIKTIGKINVKVFQYKSKISSPNIPQCKAVIRIFDNNNLIDSIEFSNIDAVGGYYGLLIYPELINNHVVISKYGDYDGRTIIINDKGQKFITIGGYSFLDISEELLFSIYDSDLSGFSVFNFNTDKEIFKMVDMGDRPQKFYKKNSKYYFLSVNDETGQKIIYEINLKKHKILKGNINVNNDYLLKEMADYEKIKINCE